MGKFAALKANIFYYLGKKVGKSWHQGRYFIKAITGSKKESLQAEYALGAILAREIEQSSSLSSMPTYQLAAESVLRRLQQKVKNKERYFNVAIVENVALNAFALPGGFIYITSALSEQLVNDPDALAFVIAHEMIHIILKHPLKRMLASYSLEGLSRVVKTGSAATIMGKDVLKKLVRSRYSQEHERMADEYGLRLLFSAGFDPDGAMRLLRLFDERQDDDRFQYFSSHPSLTQRMANLQKVSQSLEHM